MLLRVDPVTDVRQAQDCLPLSTNLIHCIPIPIQQEQ